jgi:hypothetical protein
VVCRVVLPRAVASVYRGGVAGATSTRTRTRFRLTGQLVRPALRHLRQGGGSGVELEECSRYFSRFLNSSRRPTARRRPRVDLARWGRCGIPSAWRSPTTRCPGGNNPPNRWPSLPGLPPGHRVVALEGGRRDATPISPSPCWTCHLCRPIPEVCRGAGRRAPAVGSAEPGICSVQGTYLRSSDSGR